VNCFAQIVFILNLATAGRGSQQDHAPQKRKSPAEVTFVDGAVLAEKMKEAQKSEMEQNPGENIIYQNIF